MHLYLYFNEKNLKPCKMFIYVCMYVCMYACVYKFHSEAQVPLLLFAKPPALIPHECSLNVDVEVELTHGTRLGMYGKALGYSLDF